MALQMVMEEKEDDTTKNIHAQKVKQDDMIINELTLLNLLSSRSSKSEMQEGLENLWAYSMYYGSQYCDVDLKMKVVEVSIQFILLLIINCIVH